MEDNKKNPFDDFFQSSGSEKNADKADENYNEHQSDSDKDSRQQKPAYYYSYGPFKPTGVDSNESEARRIDDGASAPGSQVEVTPPTQLRPFAPTQSARGGWKGKEPRRTSFKAVFASFLVGVVAVGSLMFVADQQNWFSSDQALSSSQPVGQGTNANAKAGDDGVVSTAADVVRPNNIAQIFEKSSPAVVKIETFVQQQSSGRNGGMLDDPFFRQFFGDEYDNQENNQDSGKSTGTLVPSGMGTGFFFDKTGYILTNQHVVGDADEIEVTVQGYNKPLKAKKLGSNYDLDLAVLKVEGSDFPTLSLGSSDKIDIGDWVVAIGNPYGFDHTVTVGVLSAKERPISIPDTNGTRNYEHLLQTDASINPGNSGGPLLNLQGEVIGINTAVSSQAQGIGFAIPTSTILENLEALKANKEIPKKPAPFIGAKLGDITAQLQQDLGLSSREGSYIDGVVYKSPAYLADLRQYDVITGMDGTKYKTKEELITAIQAKNVGDKVTMNIIRNGKSMDVVVEIGNSNDFAQQTQQQQQQQQ
ncbi:S1C family serine protease [Paenibacillus mendelii]